MTFEREGNWRDFAKGAIIGFMVSAFFLVFYMIWTSRPSANKDPATSTSRMEKNGVYIGAFLNIALLYSYLAYTY